MKVIEDLAKRLLGEKSNCFIFEKIEKYNDLNCYEIDANEDKIIIRGDCGVSVANGLYAYLKQYCNFHLSWCGNQIHIPNVLPIPSQKTRHIIPQKYRAIYNYCTFGYSMAFWDWEQWEKELDFLALNGINMPLSIVGTEAIWYYTLTEKGISSDDALNFLSGPAYYPWQGMTNFEGVLPPKSKDYIDRRLKLGQKIIKREIELGMHPVQQGFSGFVPKIFMKKYPAAKITSTRKWSKFPKTAQLDPTDSLFFEFGMSFLKKQKELFGDYGFYAADPFHESKPTVKGDAYLNNVGKIINKLFYEFNPNSVWVMQSWSLRKAIVTAVPKDRLLIFDLDGRIRQRHNNFWGYPFILGRLDNFGQKTYFHGNISRTAMNEFAVVKNNVPNIVGTGIFPEGTLSNPLYYEALFEVQTKTEPLENPKWIEDYCTRRYGVRAENAIAANKIIFDRILVEPLHESGYSSVICALPMFSIQSSGQCDYIEKPYEEKYIDIALSYMLKDADLLSSNECYRYDLADLVRQFCSNKAIILHEKFVQAYKNRDYKSYKNYKTEFLILLEMLDSVLSQFDQMNFNKWLARAHSLAENDEEFKWLDENARALLTIWGPYKNSEIYDYAWREWGGLIKDFYIPRWMMFFNQIEKPFGRIMLYIEKLIPRQSGKIKMRATPFYNKIANWTVKWVKTPAESKEYESVNSVYLCKRIYQQYKHY